MKELCVGDRLQIQCYKHDGSVHRAWDEAVLLDNKKEYMVFGNDRTRVIEAGGNTWRTKEPAVIYFFRDEWFNIICQFKKDGLYFYCNIATPFLLEEGTIKYIDYDLDLRIFPTGEYKVLDRMEYQYHHKLMHYSNDLDMVVKQALDDLIGLYKEKAIYFNSKNNQMYYEMYKQVKVEQK